MHHQCLKEGMVNGGKLLQNFSASMAGLMIPGNPERTAISSTGSICSSTFNRFKSDLCLLTYNFHLVIGTIRLEL
jgi:hypothetical protein